MFEDERVQTHYYELKKCNNVEQLKRNYLVTNIKSINY